MKTKLIIATMLLLTLSALAMPQHCPFVDENGLPCIGAVFPVGMNPAGAVYECSNGHRWVEAR